MTAEHAVTELLPPPEFGDEDTVNHYLRKADIIGALVDGRPRRAICGTRFVPSSQGAGDAAAPKAPICDECARKFASL